jgi:hypothetical protein
MVHQMDLLLLCCYVKEGRSGHLAGQILADTLS